MTMRSRQTLKQLEMEDWVHVKEPLHCFLSSQPCPPCESDSSTVRFQTLDPLKTPSNLANMTPLNPYRLLKTPVDTPGSHGVIENLETVQRSFRDTLDGHTQA